MSSKSKTGDTNIIEFKHRYKWKAEELITVGVLYAIAVTFAILGFIQEMNNGLLITAGVFLVLALAVTYLGASRKFKSRLKGTYNISETKLSIGGNGTKAELNTGLVKDVARVYVKKVSKMEGDDIMDPKDTIILASKTGKKITIPLRIAKQHGLYEIIGAAAAKTNSTQDKKVKTFMDTAATWKG